MPNATLARLIDHTALAPETTERQIITLCDEAAAHRFAAVCMMPWYVTTARARLLEIESTIPICAAIGFPNGAHLSDVKAIEAQYALDDGAMELDMVMNLAAFKSGKRDAVLADIRAVVDVAHERDAIVKVIVETALLNESEIRRACAIAVEANADFVKTSTGFGPGGATVEAVRLIRDCVPAETGVKASGGIADKATAEALVEAGADRIGTSKGMKVVEG